MDAVVAGALQQGEGSLGLDYLGGCLKSQGLSSSQGIPTSRWLPPFHTSPAPRPAVVRTARLQAAFLDSLAQQQQQQQHQTWGTLVLEAVGRRWEVHPVLN